MSPLCYVFYNNFQKQSVSECLYALEIGCALLVNMTQLTLSAELRNKICVKLGRLAVFLLQLEILNSADFYSFLFLK